MLIFIRWYNSKLANNSIALTFPIPLITVNSFKVTFNKFSTPLKWLIIYCANCKTFCFLLPVRNSNARSSLLLKFLMPFFHAFSRGCSL